MTQFDFLIARIGLFHVLSAFCGGNQKITLNMPKNVKFRTLGISILGRIFCSGKPEKILEGSGVCPTGTIKFATIPFIGRAMYSFNVPFPRYNWNKRESRLYLPKDHFEL